MVANARPSLTQTLTQYMASLPPARQRNGRQELTRFVQWCGSDRGVGELTPYEIGGYAESASIWGADTAEKLKSVKAFLTYLKNQGIIEVNLATHLKASRASKGRKRVYFKASAENAELSAEGYANLQSRLEFLKGERVQIVGDIQRAMADKDFKENSPLDAAKERQGMIESSIRELEGVLTNAVVIGSGEQNSDGRVRLGKKVTLKEASSGKRVSYTLVDSREADPVNGKISSVSPVGKALMDKVVGEEIEISVPVGTLHYVIHSIGKK